MDATTPTPLLLRVALPLPLFSYFDYQYHGDPSHVMIGSRVKVPVGRRVLIGYVMEKKESTAESPHVLKDILEILDDSPVLDDEMRWLCTWMADYYHYPFGQFIDMALPSFLKKGKALHKNKKSIFFSRQTVPPINMILNDEQAYAVNSISKALGTFQPFILQGVTGSGKTEVYLQVISEVLNRQQQVLVLVPEIGLTPQIIERFASRFPVAMATFHSKMTDRERLLVWLACKANEAKILIGTRSAVFLPMPALGLIILDEEHDLSYKQNDRCRYHARQVAIIRAKRNKTPIVLGSATPCLESLYNIEKNNYIKLSLSKRATNIPLPVIECIDMRNESLTVGLSKTFIQQMTNHLEQGNQVLLFLNRRGYSPVMMCHLCGGIVICSRCDVPMTVHLNPRQLQCHHCGKINSLKLFCEQCKNQKLETIGIGTERLEEFIKNTFSAYPLIRVDRDSVRKKQAFSEITQAVRDNQYKILIGTQMLAKGHHFPNVSLVGIVDIDSALFSGDFRAIEQIGQLITQVAGRAGREKQQGKVLLQTHQPHHPVLQILLKQGYDEFAKVLLAERQRLKLPPFSYQAMIRAEGKSLTETLSFLEEIKKIIPNSVNTIGPLPSVQPKKAGTYRASCVIESLQRPLLQKALSGLVENIARMKQSKRYRWYIDVDPIEPT